MTTTDAPSEPRSRERLGRLLAAGFVTQALVAVLVWLLVDDKEHGGWSTSDFREWLVLSAGLAVVIPAIAGVTARRLRPAGAVAAGCLLALALGCSVFIGYAVVNSA